MAVLTYIKLFTELQRSCQETVASFSYKELVEKVNAAEVVRQKLRRIFSEDEYKRYFDALDDEDLVRLAKRMNNGV